VTSTSCTTRKNILIPNEATQYLGQFCNRTPPKDRSVAESSSTQNEYEERSARRRTAHCGLGIEELTDSASYSSKLSRQVSTSAVAMAVRIGGLNPNLNLASAGVGRSQPRRPSQRPYIHADGGSLR
jgi:hypothetical protein